jgi:hypothetical protein
VRLPLPSTVTVVGFALVLATLRFALLTIQLLNDLPFGGFAVTVLDPMALITMPLA